MVDKSKTLSQVGERPAEGMFTLFVEKDKGCFLIAVHERSVYLIQGKLVSR